MVEGMVLGFSVQGAGDFLGSPVKKARYIDVRVKV